MTIITVLDTETTYTGKWNSEGSDPTAYAPANKLVSCGYRTNTGANDYIIFNHVDLKNINQKEAKDKLQKVLDESDLIVGHNLKFDMTWLFESGFTYDGPYWDTMIFEYLNARGMNVELSLDASLARHKLGIKTDILHHYCGELGLNVDQIPIDEFVKYGRNDINQTYALFRAQQTLFKTDPLIASMKPALKLMNEFLEVLIDVERNGIRIDINALNEVEEDFKGRSKKLEDKLKTMVVDVMGHTPINLNSPEQMSWVLYSLRVTDKKKWAEIFNLGSEERNGVTKQKYAKRHSETDFRAVIKANCTKVYKTVASQCGACQGQGYVQLYCKDGSPRKNKNICHTCNRSGFTYTTLPELAGFQITPLSYEYTSSGGFSSGKDTIDALIEHGLEPKAEEFLKTLKEYNAIQTYLSAFVEGIRKNTRANSILHTSFNQCITATGRLSSTRPNLQNQPRESTFPIRKCFISRFVDGFLLNADFAQLEFRVAAFLAQCKNAIADIIGKIDIHKQTATAIKGSDDISSEERQDAKKFTFRPLFGGTSGTPAQLAYFEYFFKHYDGIFRWHIELTEHAVINKYNQTPSGRVFAYPNCTRKKNGSVSFATQIKNYPVQSFATGDILPVTMILLYRMMKKLKVKSLLVLTVHDSITADIKPEEKELMIQLYKDAFAQTIPDLKKRFGVDFNIPLDFDLDIGYNLCSKQKVK